MTIVGYQSWIRYRLTLLYWYLLTTELRLRGSLPVRGTRGVGLHVDARSSGDRYSRGPAASFRALFHYGWNSRLTELIIIFLSHSLSPISCYPRTNALRSYRNGTPEAPSTPRSPSPQHRATSSSAPCCPCSPRWDLDLP